MVCRPPFSISGTPGRPLRRRRSFQGRVVGGGSAGPQTRGEGRVAHHHRGHRLAPLLLAVALLHGAAAGRTVPPARPLPPGGHQHRADANAHTRHHHLRRALRTVGRLPLGLPRPLPGLRRAALRHRRVPQAGHGTARVGGHHTRGQVERRGLPAAATALAGSRKTDWHRRLHEPRRPAHGRLSGATLRRHHPPLRHRRHPSRLHTLSRDVEHPCWSRRGPGLHHRHREQDRPRGEAAEAMGENELCAHRQARRPRTLPQPRLECLHPRVPGCAGVAAAGVHGRAFPHDVFPQRTVFPLCHRLGRTFRRAHRGPGTGHLLPRSARGQLAVGRHREADERTAPPRIGAHVLPRQVPHRRRAGHLPLREPPLQPLSRPRAAHDMGESRLAAGPHRPARAPARGHVAALVALS